MPSGAVCMLGTVMLVLPISDYPNVRGVPWVTVGVFMVQLFVLLFVAVPKSCQDAPNLLPKAAEVEAWDRRDNLSDQDRRVLEKFYLQATGESQSKYDRFLDGCSFRAGQRTLPNLGGGLFVYPGLVAAVLGLLLLFQLSDNVELHLGRARYSILLVAGGALGAGLGAGAH